MTINLKLERCAHAACHPSSNVSNASNGTHVNRNCFGSLLKAKSRNTKMVDAKTRQILCDSGWHFRPISAKYSA